MAITVCTDDQDPSFCFEFYVLLVLGGKSQVPLLPEDFLDHLTRTGTFTESYAQPETGKTKTTLPSSGYGPQQNPNSFSTTSPRWAGSK